MSGFVSIRFEVRGGFRQLNRVHGIMIRFQSALRFAVVSDGCGAPASERRMKFQSALRFAVVSDGRLLRRPRPLRGFQSALRFAVVSDASWSFDFENDEFQSALRFAVVSDAPHDF